MYIKIINEDAINCNEQADLIFADPPYEMDGKHLSRIIDNIKSNHLILLTTFKQALEFNINSEFKLNFDFVINSVIPKKTTSIRQPNYTHITCLYMTRGQTKSIFNRKLKQRSDGAHAVGYWSTIIRGARDLKNQYGKNEQTITDIVGSFEDVNTIIDPFAGSGVVGNVGIELGINVILIEINSEKSQTLKEKYKRYIM
jgi:DNA modification methylase